MELKKTDGRVLGTAVLFLACFAAVLLYCMRFGSMISLSGDAADIWKTITTYYTADRYPSYVLYKGFASVYPYVWLYQLAVLLGTNEFFFVMCYHGLLFGYIIAFGIPTLVKELTGYEPKWWQKVLLAVVLFWFWSRYKALSDLMVDLPSCAFFLLSIQCAVAIVHYSGWKRWVMVCLAGLLCGLCANISGQYSIAAACIMVFACVQIWKSAPAGRRLGRRFLAGFLPLAVLLCLAMGSVKLLNLAFQATVLQPFQDSGVYIAPAEAWMHRALIFMIDIGRLFYGSQLYDARGHEIVMSLYGAEEGTRLLELAAAGGYGWTIAEYFRAFFQHPVDFIMLYLNRLMIAISDDSGICALRSLLPCYTMVYLAIVTAIKGLKRLRDLFCAKLWLVLGALASMIPVLVMTVEMRYTLSLQSMLFGVALAGPILPRLWGTVSGGIHQCRQEKSLRSLLDRKFPWEVMGWIVFCAVCLAYFGSICAASDMGTGMLYHW
ncbi:hypothetical protein [Oscillibacter sp.]|uniref:hypothetical protein n=1 Tax=Oscillibacter sp. TaxID=1945593 RepID=UPI001B5D8358|nr:hypothetical protein [Oscillibacter sp.]MBP3509421.1 hypothetical protein [Oscillibacter sp.]